MARIVLKGLWKDRAAAPRLPQERQTTELPACTSHRHFGVPGSKARRTYTGHRAAAWSGGAIIGGIIASVIVLGFILYEVTKIVTHAGDTTTSVPRPGEASRAL
ncbi:MAG: hypothetical protein WAV78_20610 [Xanthobacteraceae bacterium]